MKELSAYHVVTEKPMYIDQHIVFDENHHNGVWQRVNEKLDIVNDIYNNPEEYNNIQLEHHTGLVNICIVEKITKFDNDIFLDFRAAGESFAGSTIRLRMACP